LSLPKPTTTEAEREANRAAQARWRKTHFLLHAEYEKIVRQLAALPGLLDNLDNPGLARRIRRVIKMLEEE
jgi:hypothetical protein